MKKDPSSEKREAKVKMKYIGSINTKEKLCPSKLDSRGFRVKSHDVLGETLREVIRNVMISCIKEKLNLLEKLVRELIPHEECEELSI